MYSIMAYMECLGLVSITRVVWHTMTVSRDDHVDQVLDGIRLFSQWTTGDTIHPDVVRQSDAHNPGSQFSLG